MKRIDQYNKVLLLMEKYKITLECLINYTTIINERRFYIPKKLRVK